MGLFSRKKPKKDEDNSGEFFKEIAIKLNKFEESGGMDMNEDSVLYLSTSEKSGSTLLMGGSRNLSKALVRSMSKDPRILTILERSISVYKAMESIGGVESLEGGMPPGLMDKLKDLMNNPGISARIVDATDPNNPKEVSLDEFENDVKKSSESKSMIDDLLKDTGIKRKKAKDFDDDLETLGE